MNLLRNIELSEITECPYFSGRECRFLYFFAREVSGSELEILLSNGWRKFGLYYFRPECPGCRECVPYRVRARNFVPAGDQRRILQKNRDVEVRFVQPAYSDEVYDIYTEHSRFRFEKGSEPKEQFEQTFFSPSCPSLQSEFYLDGSMVAVGFLDVSDISVSSVYFVYRERVHKRGMGVFGMLSEIDYAKSRGLDYYYSGYYIEDNSRMRYKGRYMPAEIFDWNASVWMERNRNGGV
jgi:arginine-tRNA-protein transferase